MGDDIFANPELQTALGRYEELGRFFEEANQSWVRFVSETDNSPEKYGVARLESDEKEFDLWERVKATRRAWEGLAVHVVEILLSLKAAKEET